MDRTARIKDDAARLCADHPVFARAAELAGDFPVRWRPTGFGTVLHLILEQQVSIDAARVMYANLRKATAPRLTPERFLALDDATLKSCGFSRQKAGYARALASALRDGSFTFRGLSRLPDNEVVMRLTALRGIGPWTAENYLLWALGRRDVFPAGDLALQIGWGLLTDGPRPTAEELRALSEPWAPRRTAAAMLIWYSYLAILGRTAG